MTANSYVETRQDIARVLAERAGEGNSQGYNLDPALNQKLLMAIGKVRRGTQNAKILCVGDSTTRGVGASAGTAAFLNGYPPQLAAQLTAAGLTAGSQNVFGSGNVTLTSSDSRIGLLNGATQGAVNTTLGGAMFQLTAATHTFAFTPTANCDTFDIYSVKTGGTGSFTINLDGGATAATVSGVTTPSTIVKTTVTGTLAAHTLNCVWASGTTYVIGVDAYNSAVKQLSIWNLGASGAKSTDLADTAVTYGELSAISFYAPDLTIIDCGINDWANGTGVSTYVTSMQAFITAAKASGDVWIMTPPPSSTASTAINVQKPYVDAMYRLADANGCSLIPVWNRFGSYAIRNAAGAYFDTLHPNGLGYSDMAAAVKAAIMRIA